MPRKTFTAGEVLAAADVNTFLMDQSVMTFADSDARGSAIPTPSEGMVTYLNDTDALEVFNGTSFVPAAPASGGGSGNAIINGAFEINQRGFSSGTEDGLFGFDRWLTFASDGTTTYSSQAFTPGAAPLAGLEAANHARLVSTGQTLASAGSWLRHKIEDVRTFAGQTVTVSFYAKAATGTPKIAVELSQIFGVGGSPSAIVNTFAGQATLSTSWERHTLTVAVPSISGKTLTAGSTLVLNLMVSSGTNFDARSGSLGIQSNTFDIWGVQLEAGSTATPFRRNANSLQGELAACQRYYFRSGSPQDAQSTARHAFGRTFTATDGEGYFDMPTTMRVAPTSVEFANLRFTDFSANNALAISSVTLSTNSNTASKAALLFVTASGTTNRFGTILNASNTAGFLAVSAEL